MAAGIRLVWYYGRYKNLHDHDPKFRREVLSGERTLLVGNILFLDATFLDENGAPFYHEPDPSKVTWRTSYNGQADTVVDGTGTLIAKGSHWALTERGDAKMEQTHGMTSKFLLAGGTQNAKGIKGFIEIEATHPHTGELVSGRVEFPNLD